MTTTNQGRNEIRFNNSGGKCLLENWVEERAVKDQGINDQAAEAKSGGQILKEGHKGLLTTNLEDCPEKLTTFQVSYTKPDQPNVRQKGSRAEMLEQMLYEQICNEVDSEFNAPPESAEMESVTHMDYNILDFEPTKKEPTAHHDYVNDQPATFWTEHKDKMHGISQIKPTFDTPFRKNASFSKPITEYMDQPKPYEHELAPNM